MAVRPVFVPVEGAPFFRAENVEFIWNSGFAKVQKQKNITALHAAFKRRRPDANVLEISGKSMQENGPALSAFSLPVHLDAERTVPLECVYQGSKCFVLGGPYTGLYEGTPSDAKRFGLLKTSGRLLGFRFNGRDYPNEPATAFYDFLYLNALLDNEPLAQTVLRYDGFTDIEYNPEKSIACQAKSAAMFVSLYRSGRLEEIRDFDRFCALYGEKATPHAAAEAPQPAQPEAPQAPALQAGMKLLHPAYGEGTVTEIRGSAAFVQFGTESEPRRLSVTWCAEHCEIL